MVRKPMMLVALSVLLGAQMVYAQEAEEAKPVRFEAFVKVTESTSGEAGDAIQVRKPGAAEPTALVPYKAYPYGTVFTLANEAARMRVNVEAFTYATVRGPAKFTFKSNADWTAVTLAADYGDFSFSVDDRVQPGQFQVVTPLGTFGSLTGRSKLQMDPVRPGEEFGEENFSFRLISGTASFQGKHFTAPELTQANAFTGAEASAELTELTGRVGEVKLDLPSGAGKTTEFPLQPGSSVKITRAKAKGSDNWTVSVLTLYNNGKAKNYFAYVENRGEGFRTGELFEEVFAEEEAAEELGEESAEEAGSASTGDDFGDFDDGDLL